MKQLYFVLKKGNLKVAVVEVYYYVYMYSNKYTAPHLREFALLTDRTTRNATFLEATVMLDKQLVVLDETMSELLI